MVLIMACKFSYFFSFHKKFIKKNDDFN